MGDCMAKLLGPLRKRGFCSFALSGMVIAWLLALTAAPAQAQLLPGCTCPAGAFPISGGQCFNPVTLLAVSQICTGFSQSSGQQATLLAGQAGILASFVGTTAVQTELRTIRDRIQSRVPAVTGRPFGFAEETESPVSPAFAALGYAKAPVYKAPPAPEPGVTYAVWGQGFGDYETRSIQFNGIDFGRTASTFGGIAGVDATIPHFFYGDAFVIGLLGGETESHISFADGSTLQVTGPSVGLYTVYVNGRFSTDSVSKIDFFDLNTTAVGGVGTPLGMTNYTSAYNVNYKVQMANNWWVEPTVGATYVTNIWDGASKAMGFTDGQDWRGQVGARVGTSYDWNGVKVQPTLTGLVYDDFFVSGNTIIAAGFGAGALVPTDEGYLFGQLIGKVDFDWGKGWTSYVEAEVRGRQDVLGAAGRVGFRYIFGTP